MEPERRAYAANGILNLLPRSFNEVEWNEWYKAEQEKKNPAAEKAAAAVTTPGDDNA